MSSPPREGHRGPSATGTRPSIPPGRGRDDGIDLMGGDIAELIRSRTPLRDDPAGRAMVRARTERIADAGSSRGIRTWSRGIVAIVPVVVLAVVLWAATSLPGGQVVTPVPTSAPAIAQRETMPDQGSRAPANTVVPRQPWSSLSTEDRGRVSAGLPPLGRTVTPRVESRPPDRARSVIVLGQVPAPRALELIRQIQRQRYGG